MSKTKFRKIMPIIIVTALVAVLLAVPCAASDVVSIASITQIKTLFILHFSLV